jgi:hypothetical protein
MSEHPSPNRPRISWGQALGLAIILGVAVGAGGATSSHDPLTGIVVGAAIFAIMIISYALIFRRRPR